MGTRADEGLVASSRELRFCSMLAASALSLSLLACSSDSKPEGDAPTTSPSVRAGADAASGSGAAGSGGSGGAAPTTSQPVATPQASSPQPDAGLPRPAAAGSGGSRPSADDDDAGVTALASKPPPDPSITFDWDETVPNANPCEAGRYVGSFTCDLDIGAEEPLVITGPVELTLTKSANGEFLEISDGRIEGVAIDIFQFVSGLSGKLDCSSRALEATAVDGKVGLGSADLLPVFDFSGMLSGTLDPTGVALSGNWSFPVTTAFGAIGTCVGPWMATWMQ